MQCFQRSSTNVIQAQRAAPVPNTWQAVLFVNSCCCSSPDITKTLWYLLYQSTALVSKMPLIYVDIILHISDVPSGDDVTNLLWRFPSDDSSMQTMFVPKTVQIRSAPRLVCWLNLPSGPSCHLGICLFPFCPAYEHLYLRVLFFVP